MKTKDFTGEYDYERTEAKTCADYFNEYADEYTPDELRKLADREANHWRVILCEQGFKDFCDEWNKLVPAYQIN